MIRNSTIVVFFLLLFATDCFAIPAFPGAEGGGAESVGGRGGSVIQVTNLNDSGAGSLRAACEAAGARTVVFRTGGTIELQTNISITDPNITIAGQTAPGGGICLSAKDVDSSTPLVITTHDVIIRYIRFRPGRGVITEQGGNCIHVYHNTYNIIIDHCSLSWSNDENIAIWSNMAGQPVPKDVTFSWNISSEGLTYGHAGCGYIVGTNLEIAGSSRRKEMTGIDVQHNFFIHNQQRNPLFGGNNTRIVNNIVYNWQWKCVQLMAGVSADVIGNLIVEGPNSNDARYEIMWRNDRGILDANASIYIVGNKGPHMTNPDADNWSMIQEVVAWVPVNGPPDETRYRRAVPMAAQTHPITVYAVADLETELLPKVGAYQRLDEDGYWVANRDSVDARLVQEYNAGTGQIPVDEDDAAIGGFPTLAAGTPYTDADQDGMPAAWEVYMGLDDANASDRNGVGGDGYTNLEKFLSGDRTPPAAEGFVTQGFTFVGFTIDLGI